jgi:hypothetical protein
LVWQEKEYGESRKNELPKTRLSPERLQALNRGNAEGLFARFKSQFPRWGTTYSGITLPEAALVAVLEVCPSG